MIDLSPQHLQTVRAILGQHVPNCEVRAFGSRVSGAAKSYSDLDLAVVAGSKKQGGAYVPPYFGGMYASSEQGRRHAKLRHVCATRECFSWGFAGRRPMGTDTRLNPDTLRHLKEAFEESDLPFRVDVLDWNETSREFQKVIEKGFEVIKACGESA